MWRHTALIYIQLMLITAAWWTDLQYIANQTFGTEWTRSQVRTMFYSCPVLPVSAENDMKINIGISHRWTSYLYNYIIRIITQTAQRSFVLDTEDEDAAQVCPDRRLKVLSKKKGRQAQSHADVFAIHTLQLIRPRCRYNRSNEQKRENP